MGVVTCLVALTVCSPALASSASATAIAAGGSLVETMGSHSCALTSTGGVECWGSNGHGQLGNGTTQDSATPVPVSGLSSGVTAIAAGGDDSCALTSGGALKCWGDNVYGELGVGSHTGPNTCLSGSACSKTPVTVFSSGIEAVAVGGTHICALRTAGTVWCSGYDLFGQLGDGNTGGQSDTPVKVINLSGVAAITAGYEHTCALTSAGAVECWGLNIYGQLGDNTTNLSAAPVSVSNLTSGVRQITAGAHHTCAITSAGGAKCWGFNQFGQLGDGTETGPSTCSSQPCSKVPVAVQGLSAGVTQISAGAEHTCALTSSGGVTCWGNSSYDQLGNGTTSGNSDTPSQVAGLGSGVAAISAGSYQTCALTTAGAVACWGDNNFGQVGDGSSGNKRATPVFVSGIAAPPKAMISAPASGKTYAIGQSVLTTFSCSEGAGGTGLDSCDDSTGAHTQSGGSGRLDTSTLGTHTYTVTATSSDGLAGATSITYSVTKSGQSGNGGSAPKLSNLKLSPKRFRAAHSGKRGGTRITYIDSARALTILRISRCVGRHRSCGKLVSVGSFKHQDRVGKNHLRFNGRVHGTALKPGRYVLVVTAVLGGHKSQPLKKRFVILV